MPALGDSALNPPQVNYYQLTSGDHAASAAASAAAHQACASMLSAEIATMGASTSSTAAVGWQGAGGAAMTMTAGAYMAILGTAVAWFEEAFAQATAIVEAYHLAETTMVPGPVSDTNRAETAALVASNIIGQNTPAILVNEAEYDRQWIHNASVMAGFQAVVSAALAVLATPPPFAPMAPNPAAALASLASAGAQTGAQGALQASAQSMQQASTAAVPASEAASAPADALSAMGAPMAMMGQLSSVAGMAGQAPQMLGQAPQMLSQFVQMPMGLLGPLSSSMGGLGAPGASASAAPLTGSPVAAGMSALNGGGGGAGGLGAGGSGVVPTSSYTRPVGSFSTPAAPKLPGGFGGVPEPVAGGVQPSGGAGTGGLYGAPMSAMGRGEGAAGTEQRQGRTMQVSLARSSGDRGDR
ncbi:PPE domain-containing protein [Mycobacterium lehmannii]|uniref:PPE domain-containing protein n=1 Tax=Mycobacterium lehmannii TaxID=2048550 RepID=UPI000B943682|nr:PPE domain-containing protein [Mycobacterium lehmannii]